MVTRPKTQAGGVESGRLAAGVLWRNTRVPFQQAVACDIMTTAWPCRPVVQRAHSLHILTPVCLRAAALGRESPTPSSSVGESTAALALSPRMATFRTHLRCFLLEACHSWTFLHQLQSFLPLSSSEIQLSLGISKAKTLGCLSGSVG